MLTIFFYALVFGFVFCLSPGAVLAETLRRGLLQGFTPALLVQIGSLVGFWFQKLSLTLSLSLFRSPSFHLIYYPYFQLDCIILCHLAFRH